MTLDNIVSAELELRRRRKNNIQLTAPKDWRQWCKTVFPKYFSQPFAQRHVDMWEWADSIEKNVKPKAFIGIWGRGGAKSTNAETIVIYLGAKGVRKYGWYVSSTQDKADQHVSNIGSMLEDQNFSKYYAKMSRRAINKYGSSKGWKRNRLHTASGFVVDAFGLDTGLRGSKIEEARPDFIIIDDVDELHESLTVILKKEAIITETVLPSGSSDCAVLFIQNLIHPDSIASRLIDGRADFLKNRTFTRVYPAIDNLTYESRVDDDGVTRYYITGGTPTWEGQDLETCQSQIFDWGLSAFLREAQHEVDRTGGIWDHIEFMHKTWYDVKDSLIRVVVWVDPAVTSTDKSDCQGISCGATINNTQMCFLYFWEGIDSPHKALKRAIYIGLEYGAEKVGVETDNGGDTWKSAYELACIEVRGELIEMWKRENPDKHIDEMPEIVLPRFDSDKAGKGHGSKAERNQRMLTDYERGLVYHMNGTHTTAEKALRRFPNPPLDLGDSMYYTWYDLIGKKKARLRIA